MNPAADALFELKQTTFYLGGAGALLLAVLLCLAVVWGLSDVPDEVHSATDANSTVPVKGYGCLNLTTAAIVIFVVILAIGAIFGGA